MSTSDFVPVQVNLTVTVYTPPGATHYCGSIRDLVESDVNFYKREGGVWFVWTYSAQEWARRDDQCPPHYIKPLQKEES